MQNQKIRVINSGTKQNIPKPQNSQQPSTYHMNNKQLDSVYQYNQDFQTKNSVRVMNIQNNNEPNKQRSTSQINAPLHNSNNNNNNNIFQKVYVKPQQKLENNNQIQNFQNQNFQGNIKENQVCQINSKAYSNQNYRDFHQNFNQPLYNQFQEDNQMSQIHKVLFQNNQNYNQIYNQDFHNYGQQQYPTSNYHQSWEQNRNFQQENYSNQQQMYSQQQNNSYQYYEPINANQFSQQIYQQQQYQIQSHPIQNPSYPKKQEQIFSNTSQVEPNNEEEFQSNDDSEIMDLKQSMMRSISYTCQHCDTKVFQDMVQLDCFHFYHPDCFKEYLQSQFKGKSYQHLVCYCQKKISVSQIRTVLNLNSNSDLMKQLLQQQIFTVFSKYQNDGKFQKCRNCNFFWIKGRHQKQQYYCQNCEKLYE